MFSIIIPTYNRCDTLEKTLSGYLHQSHSDIIDEIIIIDDGSDSINKQRNKEIVANIQQKSKFEVIYQYQKNEGPAQARNIGITCASGDYILITGDDIVPHENLVKEHFQYHENYDADGNVCVLGRIQWPIRMKITPFMQYINEMGLQFGYSLITDKNDLPFSFFYTSNISLNRSFLKKDALFDTDFPYAAWEDIELAYRLKKRGLKIIYNENAIAYHYHTISFDSFRFRQEKCGYSAMIFYQKHPELKEFLQVNNMPLNFGLKELFIKTLELLCRSSDKLSIPVTPQWYDRVLNYYYQCGLKRFYVEHNLQ
jgi:Predicted glycosyltransferases